MSASVLPAVPEYGLIILEWTDAFPADLDECDHLRETLGHAIPHDKWCIILVEPGASAAVFGPEEPFVERVKAILASADVLLA